MQEDEHAEFLRLGPDRVEFLRRQFLAIDASPDGGAAQAERLDAVDKLLDREIRMLQRHGREGDEALLMRRAEFGELFVLNPDELRREVALGLVPERIDAERLDVDALRVHRLDAVVDL